MIERILIMAGMGVLLILIIVAILCVWRWNNRRLKMFDFNPFGREYPTMTTPFLQFIARGGIPQPWVPKELPDPVFVAHLREVSRLDQEKPRA